jgi:hypothetical protein
MSYLTIKRLSTGLVVLALLHTAAAAEYSRPVDARSYNLGIIGGFAEVVRLGVKTLALSEVMSPEVMDDILPDAEVVAARNGVLLYREPDLLVTDLYPADVALGKHVLLIYTGDTLQRYLALKAHKAELVAGGRYNGEERTAVARRFGQLLSYPDAVIDELISKPR